MDDESIDERLRAVERALTDGEGAVADLSDERALNERIDDAEERVDGTEERVAELEAAVQALRGYVGNVRSVNRDVERRAESALATAEKLGTAVEDVEAAVERLERDRREPRAAADGGERDRTDGRGVQSPSGQRGGRERRTTGEVAGRAPTGPRRQSRRARRDQRDERRENDERAPHPIPACDCSLDAVAGGRDDGGVLARLRAWL